MQDPREDGGDKHARSRRRRVGGERIWSQSGPKGKPIWRFTWNAGEKRQICAFFNRCSDRAGKGVFFPRAIFYCSPGLPRTFCAELPVGSPFSSPSILRRSSTFPFLLSYHHHSARHPQRCPTTRRRRRRQRRPRKNRRPGPTNVLIQPVEEHLVALSIRYVSCALSRRYLTRSVL